MVGIWKLSTSKATFLVIISKKNIPHIFDYFHPHFIVQFHIQSCCKET